MALQFLQDFSSKISLNMIGIRRVQLIDKLITNKIGRKIEANDLLIALLKRTKEVNASDLDIGGPRSKERAWFRIQGRKEIEIGGPRYTCDEVTAMILSVLDNAQKKILYQEKSFDFALSVNLERGKKPFRFRINTFFERGFIAANFRYIKQGIFDIKALGIPEKIVKRLNLRFEKTGLFLVTGITGAGKSTTLDSIIDLNNSNNSAHIIIIGNPIEYLHESKMSIVTHRELGEDVLSFSKGAIDSLRQDPDIIVVGEMRDAKTIATVLEVTDSGHKVFTTLHTSSAVESIHRIIAEFPPNEQERVRFRLADTLKVVISQKLIPNKMGRLTMVKEILAINPSVQAAIRNNNIAEIFQMITEGSSEGMFTMHQDLLRLTKSGIITPEIAMNYANNRKVMQQLLKYS